MRSWADNEQERLSELYGERFDVWYVPRYPVGYTWHARVKGTQVAMIDADSPDELERVIMAACDARCEN
jgi:hypothetical protein